MTDLEPVANELLAAVHTLLGTLPTTSKDSPEPLRRAVKFARQAAMKAYDAGLSGRIETKIEDKAAA